MGMFENPMRKKIKEKEEEYKKQKEQEGESEAGKKFREIRESGFTASEDKDKKKRKGYFDKLTSYLKGE